MNAVADYAFAEGVRQVCPRVYVGGGGDPGHVRVRRLYRRLIRRKSSPTAGRPYGPGEFDSLMAEGREWARLTLNRGL